MFNHVKQLVLKDILLNYREKYAIYSMILYVLCTSYVSYLCFEGLIEDQSWVALFWIISLFTAINASHQTFKRELNYQAILYYTLVDPRAIVLSKIFYNSGLLITLTFCNFIIYSIFLGCPIIQYIPFISSLVIGSSALASILTLIAAIASKTNNSGGIFAILSIPLLLPLLLNLIKTTQICLLDSKFTLIGNYLLFLVLLNITSILLSYLLFPYLWKD